MGSLSCEPKHCTLEPIVANRSVILPKLSTNTKTSAFSGPSPSCLLFWNFRPDDAQPPGVHPGDVPDREGPFSSG